MIATATARDGVAYLGSSSGRFYAFDAATGERVWEVPHGGRVTSSAIATADSLYYGGLDGSVYCLDRANGAVAWSYVCGRPLPGSPVLDAGLLLIRAAPMARSTPSPPAKGLKHAARAVPFHTRCLQRY